MTASHDYAEWLAAVYDLNEMQRAATQYDQRAAFGLAGDPEDARDE